MDTLPAELLPVIVNFQPLFSKSVWKNAQTLLVGAILAIGKRTVTACLRVTGKSQDKRFQNYHRVLNRARWSALRASQVLLRMLITTFAPSGELIIGIDDTIECRRGAKIKAKGIYRDPVRSSKGHFVKVSGLRWLSAMLIVPVPWAKRLMALPFLTVLTPSERFYDNTPRVPSPCSIRLAKSPSRSIAGWRTLLLRTNRKNTSPLANGSWPSV